MSDADTVIKYIEKVGVTQAAKDLGLSRPTVYARRKNPDSVTVKEVDIVKGLQPEHEEETVPTPKWTTVMPETVAVPTVTTPNTEMRYRPGTKKSSAGPPGITLENHEERISNLEEYFKIISNNRNLQAGKETVGEAISGARPTGFSGQHPMSQLIRQGNPQDAPRPKGLRPEFDTGWNTPKAPRKD